MVFGDSNAFRPGNNRYCWPALLENLGRDRISVVNESCDGRTTHFDHGTLNGLEIIAETVKAHQPLDYVIVALGTNDMKGQYGPPTAGEIALGIEQIANCIVGQENSIRPVLATPPPIGAVDSGDLSGARHLVPVVTAICHKIASERRLPLIDIYPIIDIREDLEPDQVHLNTAGRRKVAQVSWDCFELQWLT